MTLREGGHPPEELPLFPGLTWTDAAEPWIAPSLARAELTALEQVHLRHFPDYAHMVTELETWLREGWPDPDVVVHLWLSGPPDRPFAECITHTNARRGVLLAHYLAVDEDARRSFPRGWLGKLVQAWVATGERDCAACGTDLQGVMAEVPPEHLHKWYREGFRRMAVDYVEPVGGRFWPQRGDLRMHGMEPIILFTDPASDRVAVERQALRAFLVDYYQLPEDHPEVERMLAEAARGVE